MIRSLVLKNFKPFEFEQLKFRHLTLLSGLNSTGKSSVTPTVQPMLVLELLTLYPLLSPYFHLLQVH
jgi:predicted ATPase